MLRTRTTNIRPRIELLEERALPTSYTVTSAAMNSPSTAR